MYKFRPVWKAREKRRKLRRVEILAICIFVVFVVGLVLFVVGLALNNTILAAGGFSIAMFSSIFGRGLLSLNS